LTHKDEASDFDALTVPSLFEITARYDSTAFELLPHEANGMRL
jgi:hypothetical protein